MDTKILNDQLDMLLQKSGTITGDIPLGRLTIDLGEVDKVGVSFTSLRLSTTRLRDADAKHLLKISDTLAARLNYLMEPIRTIETDPFALTVQARSVPPAKTDEGIYYYELMVRHDGVELKRYRREKDPANLVSVAAAVTREVLFRIVKDLEEVLA